MLLVPLLPWVTLMLEGAAESEKSGGDTVSVMFVVWVK